MSSWSHLHIDLVQQRAVYGHCVQTAWFSVLHTYIIVQYSIFISHLICVNMCLFHNQAGSVHVRVRRDADEQMVLAHVYNRLANLVSVLTVQIFKDDWSRPSAFQILGDPTLLSKTSESRPNLTVSTASGVQNSSTLPYLTGTQFISSASYRAASPLATGSERPEARQFIGGHGAAGSVLTSHAGVRFPPIPHYTDISSQSLSAKYSVSGSTQGYTGSSLQSTPTANVQEDKHK